MKPTGKAPGPKPSKLNCDKRLSTCAFRSNLRRINKALRRSAAEAAGAGGGGGGSGKAWQKSLATSPNAFRTQCILNPHF